MSITTRKHAEDGVEYVRFLFPHNDESASYASNVLIDFLFTLISDDSECPHGMKGDANYVDIPTFWFERALAEMEAAA